MAHRRTGAMPLGNDVQNTTLTYQNLNPQLSFGSNDSSTSVDSFTTQVPLPYHLPQDHEANNFTANQGGFAPYKQGSNSSVTSLNPNSSPYIPQGNTPVLPLAGLSSSGWGMPDPSTYPGPAFSGPAFSGGQNLPMAPSYQQSQQNNTLQYQGQYQQQGQHQPQTGAQMGERANNMTSYPLNSGPYSHFGPGFTDPNANSNANQYVNYQRSFTRADPTHSMPTYAVGQPSDSMYSAGTNSMYGYQDMRISESSQSHSFGSAPGNSQNQGRHFQSGPQSIQPSRATSGSSNASTMRFQKKSFAASNSSDGNGRSSQSRNSNQRSESGSQFGGGPVHAPRGARGGGPEKVVSGGPERKPSRGQQSRGIEDSSNHSTPIAHQQTDTGLFSAQAGNHNMTPQLRNRRGQTITSTSNAESDTSIAKWSDGVRRSSEASDGQERGRNYPINGFVAPNESDPFISSTATVAGPPFDCITPGPFTHGFGAGPMSTELMQLTQGGTRNPTLVQALDPHNIPFIEYCRQANFNNYGVVKIANIPYSTSRSEVLAFLGRNARLVNDTDYEPIHIIMERVTSKTLDCFVEFLDLGEAVSAVNRFEGNRQGGRGRLGQRHVDVELSTQNELMKQLFPKAKNVDWDNGRVRIIPTDSEDPYNSGFQGFLIKEELIMLLKHVEAPQRTPFSKECPQRSFECLVSTLFKYPWHMVHHITIEDRNILHSTTKRMLEILVERVNDEDDPVNLNSMLLKRVWRAALLCPGFTPSMKDDFVIIAQLDHRTAIESGLAPHASYWNKLWTIGPKADAPVDVLLWYIAKIRQASTTSQQLSLAEQAEKGTQRKENKLFGDLDNFINYGPNLNRQSLAEVAKIEWHAIENALRRAFTPALASN